MHRLFVALRPPLAMRERLLAVMGGVQAARWQDDSQLHLTLRFIGEVDARQAEDIATALHAVDGPRPTLALTGVGTFGSKGRHHTLWAGVARDPALVRLHDRVERAVTRAGVAPDRRAFHPHVTIARLNRATGPLDTFLSVTAGLSSPPCELDHFFLYESHLGRDGARYEPVLRYALRPADGAAD